MASRSAFFTLVLSVLAFVPAGAARADVANGAFEVTEAGRAEGWTFTAPAFRAARGLGHNGSGGLVWESDRPAGNADVARQVIELKPGVEYAYSALVRTENLKATRNGATLCVEWYGADGKWMAGAYVKGVREPNADWTLVRGVTRRIPAEARRVELLLYVEADAGKAFFDNVVVEPLVRPAVESVVVSSYRATASAGEVRFHAVLNRPKDVDGTRAFFRCRAADGQERRVPATREDATGATWAVDVAELAMGEQDVACELAGADGKVLGKASGTFRRVRELPRRRVTVDEHQRCLVDGKPFFPLGLDSGAVTAEMLAIYAQGPFNCVMPYSRLTRPQLDLCAEKGLMAIADLHHELRPEVCAEQAKALRDHPALLAWYLADEAPVTEAAAHAACYRAMVAADPEHPCVVAHDRTYDLRQFLGCFDVLEVDPYPVPDKPMGHVTAFCRETQKALFGDRPLWNCPQFFDWSWYRQRAGDRFPTEAELRSMCWQHIACGANGLVGYCFHAYFQNGRDKEYRRWWDPVCRVCAEVKRMIPVLLSVEEAPAVTDAPADMPVRAWASAGELFVLVCNPADVSRNVALSVAGQRRLRLVGVEVGAAQDVKVSGNRLTMALPPLGVALVRLADD